MKHGKISHQTTDFQTNFLQGLKVTVTPKSVLTPRFGSHLLFSCPGLTTWGSLSGELVDLDNLLENSEARSLDLNKEVNLFP